MKVIKNFFYNSLSQLFVIIVPLITTPYLARVIGPKGVGINTVTSSFLFYFVALGGLGVAIYGNRQIAYVRDNKEKLTDTFYEIFFMKIVTVTFAFLLFLICLFFIKEYREYYLAQSVALLATAIDITWFFQGVENFAVTVVRNFIVKIITLVCIFMFVKSYNDLYLYILINCLSLVIGNLTMFSSLKKYIGKPNWHQLKIFSHFKPSIVLFIPDMATQTYSVVNKSMLGLLTTYTISGFFDQSDKIIKLSLALITATGMVMLPHVANAFKNGEMKKVKNYLYSTFEFVTAISIPLMFGIAAVAPTLIPLFLSDKFLSVTPIIMVESVAVILIGWSNVIGMQYLIPTGQNKEYNYSVILGAVINVIANVPLILLFKAEGAAIATILSELTVLTVQLFIVRNQVSFSRLFNGYWKYLISGFIMFLIVFPMCVYINRSWLVLLIEVLIGMISYSSLLLIMKPKLVSVTIGKFLNRKNNGK